MKLVKLLPLLILLGGGGVTVTQGPKMVDAAVTKVKILVTGMELARIGDEIRFEFLSYGRVPGERDPDAFADFLRENFQPYWGSRDTSTDMWGARFLLAPRRRGEDKVRVSSNGPNKSPDSCGVLDGRKTQSPTADDICATIGLPER